MKVLIEIPKKAISIATAMLYQSAEDEKTEKAIEQALQRCSDKVTEVSLDESELGETKLQIEASFAMVAIALHVKEIMEQAEPRFKVGDVVVSTKNRRLTYKILQVGLVNELGQLDYEVEIFTDGNRKEVPNIHFIAVNKMDDWGELISDVDKEGGQQ